MLSSPSSGANSGAKTLFAISFERSEQRSEEASLSRYFLGSTRSRAKKPFHISFSSSSLLFSFSLSRSLSLFSGEGEWESPFSSLRLSSRVEHREESGGGERGHVTEGNQNSSRGQKKNPRNNKKKPKPQTGGLAHRRLLLAPSRGDAHVYLPDGRRGHPAQLQAHGGVRGAHLHADDAGRQGEARVFFLFFVFCLRVPRAASGGRNLLLLSLYSLSFPLFPSFLSISLSSEESYRRQGKREKRASEREAAPLSAARGVFGERFFSSFLCLTLSPSLPPQQQRQKTHSTDDLRQVPLEALLRRQVPPRRRGRARRRRQPLARDAGPLRVDRLGGLPRVAALDPDDGPRRGGQLRLRPARRDEDLARGPVPAAAGGAHGAEQEPRQLLQRERDAGERRERVSLGPFFFLSLLSLSLCGSSSLSFSLSVSLSSFSLRLRIPSSHPRNLNPRW